MQHRDTARLVLNLIIAASIVGVPYSMHVSKARADVLPKEIADAAVVADDAESPDATQASDQDPSADGDKRMEDAKSPQEDVCEVAESTPPAGETPADPQTPAAEEPRDSDDAITNVEEFIGSLEEYRAAFDAVRAEYAAENGKLQALQDERASVVVKINKFQDEVQRAQVVFDAASAELETLESGGMDSLLLRISQPSETDAKAHLLRSLIEDRGNVIVSSGAACSGLERRKEELDELMREQGAVRRCALEKVNACACEVEAACSRARQMSNDTVSAVADSSESGAETWASRAMRIGSGIVRIAEIETLLASWYAETDSMSGKHPGLSFGEGADFAMNQDVFVAKWGNAIDAFFEDYAREAGPVPLQGYGKTIAASAYRHRVDPRLCAAVSVAESSGGRLCIKPHNAWGWGAADTNPYELAVSWESWEESIEEWHKGMANSKTGLATARTVSTLAVVYCSTPIWGASVSESMRAISAKTL